MDKQLVEEFLLRDKRSLSTKEQSNLTLLVNTLEEAFEDFDTYTGTLKGGVPVVIFGSYGKSVDAKGVNRPAFGLYKSLGSDGCSFGLRFDAKELQEKVKEITAYEHRFLLSELDENKVELKKYIQALKSMPEIDIRMSGKGRFIIDNKEVPQGRRAGTHNPDWREDVETTIKVRRGQPAFRKELLRVYGNKCAVTGCSIEALLEAAHIIPHSQGVNYAVSNGLLLRADIHTLYDLGLLTIAGDGAISLAEELNDDPTYGVIANKACINFPSVAPNILRKLEGSLASRAENARSLPRRTK